MQVSEPRVAFVMERALRGYPANQVLGIGSCHRHGVLKLDGAGVSRVHVEESRRWWSELYGSVPPYVGDSKSCKFELHLEAVP